MKLPENGISREDALARLAKMRENDLHWRDGKTFAYVYQPTPEAEEVAKTAYGEFLSENALDPTAFPSVMAMENDVLAMAAAHLGGDPAKVWGSFTSGGTESIICAVKSARDHARTHRSHITRPRMIIPVTAHAAFHKAAHYLCVELDLVEVDPETFGASPEALAAAITDDTILLVGSAPSYAHGACDDIVGIGALAKERGLLFHVDGCMGGWMLPLYKKLGADVPDFDLSVPGVTSISMDLHKYAYCPKGASVVLYNDKDLKAHQIFSCSNWTGYTIINPTVQSTKSAGPVAAAWTLSQYLGLDGYLDLARPVLEATIAAKQGINEIPGLRVMGDPLMPLIAVVSDEVDIFHVVDEMKVRGWYIQPQMGLRRPDGTRYRENFHLSLNATSAKQVPGMLVALRESVEAARAYPKIDMAAQLQTMLAGFDLEKLSDDAFGDLMGMAGVQGTNLPERMAAINGLLDALPPQIADKVLTAFFTNLNHASE
ncbi:MAG: aspartate aminotransferase family protein [Proteobacteria bacterium]|nr:aspartate aminotransferase family protein [Pseudomonadota bacterium]